MRLACLLALLAAASPALAQRKGSAKGAKPVVDMNSVPVQGAQKQPKVKTYDFGGLDVEGRLRTPQLLYFLNRMKSEFDTTTPDKKSFMPELKRSGDDL